jgi:hypothetical protein
VTDPFTETIKLLRSQGRDDLATALVEQDQASAPEPPASRYVGQPRSEDELWQQAASSAAWKAITAAPSRAGRPIE